MKTLGIELKKDTPEKLASVSGKPTENYLFAHEVNKLTSVVQWLMNLTTVNATNIEQILDGQTIVDLGTIEGSFVDAINSSIEMTLDEGCFVIYQVDSVTYVQLFVGETGVYGSTTITVSPSQFVLFYQSDAVDLLPKSKFYKVSLSQDMTSAPTKAFEKSDLTGVVTTGYMSTGTYRLISSNNEFTEGKTRILFSVNDFGARIAAKWISTSEIRIYTGDYVVGFQNGILQNTDFFIEIEP